MYLKRGFNVLIELLGKALTGMHNIFNKTHYISTTHKDLNQSIL
jgi:hypothetical protein